MDKNAIKTFAINSRRKLMEDVAFQMNLLGISDKGIAEPSSSAEGMETYELSGTSHTIYDNQIKQRESLVREVKNKGFENVVEEVAYTWFNRIIAIRFMEVNNYLPTRTRVLSSEIKGKIEPDIVTEALDLDLDYTDEDINKITSLKISNHQDELFQFLFIKQCNKLNEILPGLFENTEDYMELLLNINFTDSENIIQKIINSLPESYFYDSVEIIGWLYQHYIFEQKDKAINIIKSNEIKKEDISHATQLFTPNWIVKYMVENSLGRYWVERNKNSDLINKMDYYFHEPEQNNDVTRICENLRNVNIQPEDIKIFDPCMGSGHILVYAFDLLMEMYKESGYSENEIPNLILENNLFGLDIDKRAYQLAYFALMMKARRYDRNIFKKRTVLKVYSFHESKVDIELINYIKSIDSELSLDIEYLIQLFANSKEEGSLIKVKELDISKMREKLNQIFRFKSDNLLHLKFFESFEKEILPLLDQAEVLLSKYQIVVTNPPYLNKFNKYFKNYVKQNYKDYSKDLFSIFIYRNFDFCVKGGYLGFMTPIVWMFIKTYEKLRDFIIENKSIVSLIEFEYHTLYELDAHVPACTFILSNCDYNMEYNGTFLKLSEFTGGLNVQKQKTLEALNSEVDYKYICNTKKFKEIPGHPIAFWINDSLINAFVKGNQLDSVGDVKVGMATANNDQFLRLWFEVNYDKIGLNFRNREEAKETKFKWFPYNKGGKYRKWYGNQEYVVNWEFDGFELKNYKRAVLRNSSYYFRKSITWTLLSASYFGVRFSPYGFLFDVNGSSLFVNDEKLYYYIGGFLCSKLASVFLAILNPTLAFQVGNIKTLPFIYDDIELNEINNLVKRNIQISKNDWDDFETSWGFKSHPFLKFKCNNLNNTFLVWDKFKKDQFEELKENEVKLNQIYTNIYSIHDLSPYVRDNEIALAKSDYCRDIKSFISYAVGCMFGRYSLDEEGLIFAGGKFDLDKYSEFVPDEDNIIPVLDTGYFADDIVGLFVEFVKICFGEENLEKNLDFIAGALKNKGNSNREIIRNYFLNDFFKDHVKTYQKCPIYWQFDSGKENGFKCLIYMHRYDKDLVARVRTDYLFKTQKAIEDKISYYDNIINISTNTKEKSQAKKDKIKLVKQLAETREYDEVLAHIANEQIEIDLDDGVKVNYAKFQNIEVSKEGGKTKKINLLKKI